jgi:exodeoxyribonuclease VII small subunit
MSEKSFEEQLKALETIVKVLEEGDLPLEEAMQKYTEGMSLAKKAAERLEKAKVVLKEMLASNQEVDLDEETIDAP